MGSLGESDVLIKLTAFADGEKYVFPRVHTLVVGGVARTTVLDVSTMTLPTLLNATLSKVMPVVPLPRKGDTGVVTIP